MEFFKGKRRVKCILKLKHILWVPCLNFLFLSILPKVFYWLISLNWSYRWLTFCNQTLNSVEFSSSDHIHYHTPWFPKVLLSHLNFITSYKFFLVLMSDIMGMNFPIYGHEVHPVHCPLLKQDRKTHYGMVLCATKQVGSPSSFLPDKTLQFLKFHFRWNKVINSTLEMSLGLQHTL